MTLRAVAPEFAVVAIVLGVAAVTLHRQFDLLTRLVVTARTGQLPMRAGQREPGLFVVIEIPVIPAARVVALAAGLAETALVFVIGTMTIAANARGVLEHAIHVTACAGQRVVQTDQREFGQAVVEGELLFPARFGMTFFAGVALLPLVYVVGAVAADAGRRQLWHFFARTTANTAAMAAVAGHILVLAFQRKIGVAGVIEFAVLPRRLAVALLAFTAIIAFVYVVATMAVDAGRAQLHFELALFVAAVAVGFGVTAAQRKMGVTVVIEADFFP